MLAAWAVAVAAIVVLAVAVWHYLDSGSAGAAMPGMVMTEHSASDSLTRAGSLPTRTLLGGALLSAWQLDALALALVVLLGALYLTGVALVPVRTPGARWPVQRTLCFLFGLLVIAFATNGSIAVYDQVLFTAHMVGHLLLVMVAPTLLVAGQPLTLWQQASARGDRVTAFARGRFMSLATAPPVALACYTIVIVGSHLTGLMDTIMRNTWAGQVEHLVYLLVGMQFFTLIVGTEPIRWRLGTPARWLLLAIGMAVDTFTGVVLLQGTRTVDMLHDPALHVDTLSDTRTGGAIMWFGGDAVMALVMIVLVVGWLRRVDTDRADRKGWLEQARVANFSANTGAPRDAAPDVETFDDDDAARDSYNAWLARLDRHS